ncbi:hypothetical protein [Micromonospora sp. NBC_01813]|uniref:hypothetical protein n=1 Tax=Micromonospora sp. NBC_01813 TaxID=2975988 RepID=UPI002DD7B447|nr:hypothetical protein [Micromonospora sp. NBC_01813]WSA08499.1 hypothetical protein OG958_30675 [Micromonospora sp. NBC_01813]
MNAEFERLVAHLRHLNRPVVSILRPGVDVARFAPSFGVSGLPPSVVEWFGWCNGVERYLGQLQDDVNVIPAYNPLSIDEAIDAIPSYRGDPVLGEYFLPLLTTAGGDIYAAIWDRSGSEASVAGVLVGESTEIEFSGIDKMMSVFNACFEGGAFFVGDDGRLVMDPEIYEEIYAQVISG